MSPFNNCRWLCAPAPTASALPFASSFREFRGSFAGIAYARDSFHPPEKVLFLTRRHACIMYFIFADRLRCRSSPTKNIGATAQNNSHSQAHYPGIVHVWLSDAYARCLQPQSTCASLRACRLARGELRSTKIARYSCRTGVGAGRQAAHFSSCLKVVTLTTG